MPLLSWPGAQGFFERKGLGRRAVTKGADVGASIGVIIGVIVLLVSIGFVVLMMVSEWGGSGEVLEAEGSSGAPQAKVQAHAEGSRPKRARAAAARPKSKAAPKPKKKPAKKKSSQR